MTITEPAFADDVVEQTTVDAAELQRFTPYELADSWKASVAGSEQADLLGVLLSAEAERMVAIAVSQIGVAESGGENRGTPLTRYVHWFSPGSGPVPWCAYFVSWCWDRATDSNHRVPWSNPGYCGSIVDWAGRTGHRVSRPQRGDIYVYNNLSHCGIVESVGTNTFTSIDGNWSNRVSRVPGRSFSGYTYIRL
ncbi:MAG: CHAP domain-containing protein [Ilumatobacteraceae bacterium]